MKLSNLTNTPARSIASAADGVITRRNQQMHFASAAELEFEVQRCQQLITANPALRQQRKWECWVITSFAHFKAAFAPALES